MLKPQSRRTIGTLLESRFIWRGAVASLVALGVFAYVLLRGRYRTENIDDSWYLSIAWSYLRDGRPDDPVYGGNTGGVQVFGKTYALLWGAILDRAGWTKAGGQAIATVVTFIGAGLWIDTARRITLDNRQTIAFGLLLFTNEAFFAAANQARPDSLTFLFVAMTVSATIRGWYSVATFFMMLAFESHPVGMISAAFIITMLLAKAPSPLRVAGTWGHLLAGTVVGVLAYLLLHGAHLDAYGRTITENLGVGNFLWAYYFETTYLRHLPELGLLIGAALVAWRVRGPSQSVEVLALGGAAILSTMLFPRGNFHYAVLVMPALLLFLVSQAERVRALSPLLLVHFVLLAPQYAFVGFLNRKFDMVDYLGAVEGLVPDDDLPVLGRPNAWFAYQDRQFISFGYQGDFQNLDISEFWWIEEPVWDGLATTDLKSAVSSEYVSMEVRAEAAYLGESIRVRRMVRRNGEGGAP